MKLYNKKGFSIKLRHGFYSIRFRRVWKLWKNNLKGHIGIYVPRLFLETKHTTISCMTVSLCLAPTPPVTIYQGQRRLDRPPNKQRPPHLKNKAATRSRLHPRPKRRPRPRHVHIRSDHCLYFDWHSFEHISALSLPITFHRRPPKKTRSSQSIAMYYYTSTNQQKQLQKNG